MVVLTRVANVATRIVCVRKGTNECSLKGNEKREGVGGREGLAIVVVVAVVGGGGGGGEGGERGAAAGGGGGRGGGSAGGEEIRVAAVAAVRGRL